jgi:hypothetical protein
VVRAVFLKASSNLKARCFPDPNPWREAFRSKLPLVMSCSIMCAGNLGGSAGNPGPQPSSYYAIFVCAPCGKQASSNTLGSSPSARVEKPTAGQTTTPLRQDTPPLQGCALKMSLSANSTVGQICEHSARWLRWVNLVSTQKDGSVSESTGGSISESFKGINRRQVIRIQKSCLPGVKLPYIESVHPRVDCLLVQTFPHRPASFRILDNVPFFSGLLL